MNIEGLSLDQLRAVIAVVDTGSFSAAARKFGRAQSAVSYAVQTAETQLGVDLFDRGGYRPTLTTAGRALIPDIRAVVARADDLQSRARAVASGIEAEVVLVVDAICSPDALGRMLYAFQLAYPTVAVRLHVETLGMIIERVSTTAGALGVIATMIDLPDGFSRFTMPPVRMSAVVGRRHALASSDEISAARIQECVQVVLSDRSRRTEGRDYAVFSPKTWRVDDLAAKHALIRAGVGWGSLPVWMTARDLAEGQLQEIRVPGLPETDDMPTQAFHDAGHTLGPASRWLLQHLCTDGLG